MLIGQKAFLRRSACSLPLTPPQFEKAVLTVSLLSRTKARMVDDALAVAHVRDEQALLQKYGSSLIQGEFVTLCP